MKKVYIVMGSYAYEGFCEPSGVFSKKKDAEKMKEKLEKNSFFDDVVVFEYDVDVNE